MIARLVVVVVGAGSYGSAIALACAGPLAAAPLAVVAGAAGAALLLWAVGAR